KDDQKPEDGDKPKDDQKPEEDHKEEDIPGLLFPQPDNARELTGYPAERLYAILTSKKFDQVLPLGGTHISKEQLAEIKAFTDQLIASSSAKNQKEKHDVLFRWIRKHVKYGHVVDPSIPDYNSAYTTFKYKNAICQGYSNLLKVFCYTQGINAPVVNGLARFNTLGNPGGHAWNYVLLDGKWYVSDATNGIFYDANDKKKFNYLLPEHIDFALWEDDKMVYTYQNRELTISAVRDSYSDSKLTVPYSVGGFRISNFNPNTISKSVREIYLGSNIKLLGPSDHRQLLISGKNLEKIAVDPKNPHLESYKGAIYDRKNSPDTPILIPAKLKHIYLKPIKQVGKNVIYGHLGVEVLHFAEGTEIIDNFAVENCPNLRTVYLSKSIKEVGNRAFDGCHPSLKKIQR
ncbi:transglutaminase domain-containing protein, partial [Porphyromonas sp.]|uniref:transglutaminase domain-containing protein n=1 Tax=Porphyromonas sp. TaxID=1924944 RepID=UPI0026DB94D9